MVNLNIYKKIKVIFAINNFVINNQIKVTITITIVISEKMRVQILTNFPTYERGPW